MLLLDWFQEMLFYNDRKKEMLNSVFQSDMSSWLVRGKQKTKFIVEGEEQYNG